MHDLFEDLTEMCEVLAEELSKTNEKLEKAGGEISAGDLEYIDKLTHALKSVKTTKAMMESEDEGWSYEGGGTGGSYEYSRQRGGRGGSSYARGGGRGRGGNRGGRSNARGGSRGGYSSARGYSRANEEMVMELRELMEDAPDEKTRMEFERFISKMEKM